MKFLITTLILLAPLPAWAELKLSDLVGEWSGQGTYAEGISSAKMRCNLSITGTDAMIRMKGRCGSSLGAERLLLDFTRRTDGTVTANSGPGAPSSDSNIGGLYGTPQSNQLIVSGVAEGESVKMELLLNADGSLHFATQRTWTGKTGTSVVTLIRR